MRYLVLGFILLCAVVVSVAGFRGGTSRRPPIEVFPDMDRQPKLRPQTLNSFFADGSSSRPPVPGTVARGARYEDMPANTGRIPGTTNFVETIPVPITAQLLARGQQRYQINCSPCHGALGDGNGITKKYGMVAVKNLHEPPIVRQPDGEIFNTITYGKNLMGAYGPNVPIEDRWGIIAYLRALQRSRLGTIEDVPEPLRATLKK